MQFFVPLRIGAIAVLAAIVCHGARGQDSQGKDAQTLQAKSVPPRATPADYLAHAQAGTITIGAEFTGHSVATPDAILSTEDYVAVEVGIFGPPDARLKLSYENFSIRINGKKAPSPAQPYALVFDSLKDPEWSPPGAAEPKSKGGLSAGGKGAGDTDSQPAPVRVPIELKRAMQLRVQRASFPEGERNLPAAGLIFFEHRGKSAGIHSIELIYSGSAGKAVLALQP